MSDMGFEGYLTELGLKYGTDKATYHKYTDFYQQFLPKPNFRYTEQYNFLEIGIQGGRSFKMWMEYLRLIPKLWLCGVDMSINQIELSPGKTLLEEFDPSWTSLINYKIDRQRDSSMSELISQFKHKDFDWILDDASHNMEDQQFTMGCLWPLVKPGSYYVLEDLQTSFMPGWKDGLTTFQWITQGFKGSPYTNDIKDIDRYFLFQNTSNGINNSMTCVIRKSE